MVAIGAFAPFLPYLGMQFVNDWGYFNSLVLVVRSIVWEYGRFPLHNPWVCGGLDLLTNPQNRIFSPLMLLDLLFRPQWANVAGLMAYAALGFIGARLFLVQFGVSQLVATVGAILFLHGNWFGFHYTEGHIPFGTMQLLPWMAYLAMRCGSRRNFILLGLTVSVMLLDGGMYAFVFSILTIATLLVMGRIPLAELKAALLSRPFETAGVIVATGLLATPKMLPVLRALRDRGPELDFHSMSPELIKLALFSPFTSLFEQPANTSWRFHEFACYLSPLGLVLIFIGGTRPLQYWKRAWPLLLAALFWFWVGSGYWPEWNPWLAFQRVPLINNAHVQSRVLLIMFVFFVILVTLALERLRERHVVAFAVPALLLVVEAVIVHGKPMREIVRPENTRAPTTLIAGRQIQYTRETSFHEIPQHYYERLGSAKCYEPSFRPPSQVIHHLGGNGYCGEACLDDPNAGWVQITRHSPGRITLDFELQKHTSFDLNTNALYGWHVRDAAAAKLSGFGYERLKVEPSARKGKLRLYYRPTYLPWVFASLLAGIALFTALWIRSRSGAGSPH